MADDATGLRTTVYMPLDEIGRALINPHGHDEAAIAHGITELGIVDLAVLDERTGRLVAGHGRLDDIVRRRAAGETPPDGVLVDDDGTWRMAVSRGWSSRDDDQAHAAGILLNHTPMLGGWDDGELGQLLEHLNAADPALLELTRFTEDDLAAILAIDDGDGDSGADLGDPDELPPAPATQAITQPGDLWLLGPHRLLCGDSMKRETYETLLRGERPELMVTDPPYGVAVGSNSAKNSISGDLTQAAIPVSLALCIEVLSPDARLYLFGGSANWGMYAGLFDVHLRMQPRLVVWVKEHFVLRRTGYHSQFEMVYYGWKGAGGSLENWHGDRKGTDVWQVARDLVADRRHPTQKPVEVCLIPIVNSLARGGLVLEPFGGSGSTLIAAHLSGRVCRTIEMDPRFCDVICARYEKLTGEQPVHKATGVARSFLVDEPDGE